MGNVDVLRSPLLALFCSVKCPGRLILRTYDLARALRDAGVATIGGFQTPMERECLAVLLRGKQPVVVCPARGIGGMRTPAEWREALAEGRLLVVSPFGQGERRTTAALAEHRNRFVAGAASAVLAVHAAPGGKTEGFCRELVAAGSVVWTVDDPDNAGLVRIGAQPVAVEEVAARFRQAVVAR